MLAELQLYELIQNIFDAAKVASENRTDIINQLIHVSLLSTSAELVKSAGSPTKMIVSTSDDKMLEQMVSHYGETAVKTVLIRLIKANTAVTIMEYLSRLEPERRDIVTQMISEIDIKNLANLPEELLGML